MSKYICDVCGEPLIVVEAKKVMTYFHIDPKTGQRIFANSWAGDTATIRTIECKIFAMHNTGWKFSFFSNMPVREDGS